MTGGVPHLPVNPSPSTSTACPSLVPTACVGGNPCDSRNLPATQREPTLLAPPPKVESSTGWDSRKGREWVDGRDDQSLSASRQPQRGKRGVYLNAHVFGVSWFGLVGFGFVWVVWFDGRLVRSCGPAPPTARQHTARVAKSSA